MIDAVLFKSDNRFQTFRSKLKEYGVNTTILDFAEQDWITFDYSKTHFIIYYSTFKFSSNHPHALLEVKDNLMYIHSKYPNVKIYPDPKIIKYYNDKYKQFLFLKGNDYPIPPTIPLYSEDAIDLAESEFGYPMVVKNRFGAGGGSVYRVNSKKELLAYYNISRLNLFNFGSAKYFFNMMTKREFYYWLIKAKKVNYPLLSPPLLAQKFVKIDRDLKTVVGRCKVVEAHWRFQAHEQQWKVNIDDGGIGVWAEVPQEAIDLSVRLAKELEASWLNIDMIMENGNFLITEFSPVWHHYAYKEKPTFEYRDDYNIDFPLEISLDLERIIIESLIESVKDGKG